MRMLFPRLRLHYRESLLMLVDLHEMHLLIVRLRQRVYQQILNFSLKMPLGRYYYIFTACSIICRDGASVRIKRER